MTKTIDKDTVAVVRCEQCKFGTPFFDERGNRMVMCYIHAVELGAWTVRPEWFCADGESNENTELTDNLNGE
ncbi:MAG: hypothetical protein II227_03810 [Clostridia bacterium]|nr:hypothetical protein [Clostridia bacterium]